MAVVGPPGRCGRSRPGRDRRPIELAAYGGTPDVAAALGWGWIAAGDAPPTSSPRPPGTPASPRRSGCTCPVVVHADAAVARRAMTTPLLAALAEAAPADGMVVGDPDRLGAVIDEYVALGVERIVLDDVLAFGSARAARGGPGRGP